MSGVEKFSSEQPQLVNALPIALGGSDGDVQLVRAGLALQDEIAQQRTAVHSHPDSVVPRGDQPTYSAHDVTVTATNLDSIHAVMYEVELDPSEAEPEIRLPRYSFVLTLQLVHEGVKLHKDTRQRVIVRRPGEEDHTEVIGCNAVRMQTLILGRAMRQLKEQRHE